MYKTIDTRTIDKSMTQSRNTDTYAEINNTESSATMSEYQNLAKPKEKYNDLIKQSQVLALSIKQDLFFSFQN